MEPLTRENDQIVSHVVERLISLEVEVLEREPNAMSVGETNETRCYCIFPQDDKGEILPWRALPYGPKGMMTISKISQLLNSFSTGIYLEDFLEIYEDKKREKLDLGSMDFKNVFDFLYHLAIPPHGLIEFRVRGNSIYVMAHQQSKLNPLKVKVQQEVLHGKVLIKPMEFLRLSGGCDLNCVHDLSTYAQLQLETLKPIPLVSENLQHYVKGVSSEWLRNWISEQAALTAPSIQYSDSLPSSTSVGNLSEFDSSFVNDEKSNVGVLYETEKKLHQFDKFGISSNSSKASSQDTDASKEANKQANKDMKKEVKKEVNEKELKKEFEKLELNEVKKASQPLASFKMIGKKANDALLDAKVSAPSFGFGRNKKKKSGKVLAPTPRQGPTLCKKPMKSVVVQDPVKFNIPKNVAPPPAPAEHKFSNDIPIFTPIRRTLMSNTSSTLVKLD